MTSIKITPTLIAGMCMIMILTACNGTGIKSLPATPTQTHAITAEPFSLATPYSEQPASGICAGFDAEMVTVTIYPDIPDPRCTKVKVDQELTIINRTENTLQISIGRFTASLEPGAQTTFDTPFGEYLSPGVHQLLVSPCCGAELWLEEK